MDRLYHHGVKGMHWGVRRYQNEDGTLTNAGKKRYDLGDFSINKEKVKKVAKIAGVTAGAIVVGSTLRSSTVVGKMAVGKINNMVGVKMYSDMLHTEAPILKKGSSVYHLYRPKIGSTATADFKTFDRMYATHTKADRNRYLTAFPIKGKGLGNRTVAEYTLKKDYKVMPNNVHSEMQRQLINRQDIVGQIGRFGQGTDQKARKINILNSKLEKLNAKIAARAPRLAIIKRYGKVDTSQLINENLKLAKNATTQREKDYYLSKALQYEVGANPNGHVAKEYYKAVKDKGYDAVRDYVDGGTLGKSPVILVNMSDMTHAGEKTYKNIHRAFGFIKIR